MSIPVTIIGAGITSLSTAYHLTTTNPGKYAITVIARDLPGDSPSKNWASPWAGAIFHPQVTMLPLHQRMQITSFLFYHSLALSKTHSPSQTGIKLYPTTEYYDSVSLTSSSADELNSWIHSLMPDFKVLSAEELPKGGDIKITSGVSYTSLAINPPIFLIWLREQLEGKGVKFIRQTLTSLSSLSTTGATGAKIIINCSGLGAKILADDEKVESVRGQTMFVKSSFDQLMIREGSEYTYIIPRPFSGGVILGGVKDTSSSGFEADKETRGDILKRINLLSGGAFEGVDLNSDAGEGDGVQDIVGFRPGRNGGLRVEREGRVVHAYGMGGAGYIYSFGVAERVGELIEELENGEN